MRIRITLLSCLAVAFTFGADTRPSFDVASIKADQSDTGVDHFRNSGGTFLAINFSLRRYITMAYGLPDSREYLLSGPEWLDSEHFDITAKYPAGASNEDSLLMLQRLLEDRFGLKVHHETPRFHRLRPRRRKERTEAQSRGASDRFCRCAELPLWWAAGRVYCPEWPCIGVLDFHDWSGRPSITSVVRT
jgi:hypothetical protein